MKKKFKIKTIEDIALQFIRHSGSNIPTKKIKKINPNDTIIEAKFYIKKYKKNPAQNLSNSFSRLVPYEDDLNSGESKSNLKLIKFYKIPQKIIGEEEVEFIFDHKQISQNSNKAVNHTKSKLREIKTLKFNKKTKIYFNIDYQNTYKSIKEIYLPLLQNLESINSLKTNTESTISCIEFFCSHNSIFELLDLTEDKNKINNNTILELMTELKIYENVLISHILFILHIILEAKIDYIDNFNEDDIVEIYQNCLNVTNKIYEIIIIILKLNEKNNKMNNINKYNTSKFVNDFYKKETKIISEEQMINIINENSSFCLKTLYNSCDILLGNLIIFKKESGNLDLPDNIENKFLSNYYFNSNNEEKTKEKTKEKIYLSKEFNDQYICFKTIYLYFTYNKNDDNKNRNKPEIENYEFLSQSESNMILSKLTTVFSSCKEISNNFLLYYTNFKILLEKNKVKPPFLGQPSNPNKIFTLVVDLDETLVHYVEEENRAYVQVRPYADYFLTEMGKYFEIVIFTAAAEDYADIVLNELDKNKAIDYKLYRKHTEQINGVFIKDLRKLGRDINKVVIIDNNKDNFSLQPENGLHICSFLGDQNDNELYLLSEDLMKIVKGNKKDLRPAVKEIDSIMKERYKTKNVILE